MMGFKFADNVFAVIGRGDFIIPLVYIDKLVDAILISLENNDSIGKVYNVVDSDRVTRRQYMELFLRRLYPNARYFYIPYIMLFATVFMQQWLLKLFRGPPFLTTYRLVSCQESIEYDTTKIRNELGWFAPFTVSDASESIVRSEAERP